MEANSISHLKITFLSEEVTRLNEKIIDYEEMLKLNKDALKSALNIQIPEDASRKTLDSAHNEDDTQSIKALKSIITKLERENMILSTNLEKLNKEWFLSQSRSLINEQIADAAHSRELEVIKDYEKKIKNLYELVTRKEKRVEELEKTKPTSEHEGMIIQNREIISPNEKVMKLHNELEIQKWALVNITKEMAKIREEKKELLTINYNMANEITKMKSPRKISFLQNNKELIPYPEGNNEEAILNFHKKFLNESSGDSNHELSPQESPLPEKIIHSAKKVLPKASMKILNIPKLDLTQAKIIQEINAKKITPQPNMNNVDPKLQEKIRNMEIEIIKTKKMLQKEMCQNKMFSCELETLQKENKSLKVKNETIMKLYKNYEEKWEKLNHNYNFFKDFYLNCLLKAFQNNLSKSFLEFFHFYFPETSLEKLYEARENLHTFIGPSKINNEQFEERLIDLEVSEVFEANPLEYENDNIDSSLLKVKYQRYLYKIAEELSFNYRIPKEDLQKVSTDHTYMMSPQQYVALPLKRRCKRSLSNTLEHIASHKKQEFNKFFMFYNQEIVEYGRFKKSMQPRNYPQTNEYFYNNNNDNNNYNNEEEGLVESQDWVEKGNTENMIGENRN